MRGAATGRLSGMSSTSARSLIERHAAEQAPSRRRSLGSHATPESLAVMLVEVALGHLGGLPRLVVDPACGAGSFLLAAADALVARGVAPRDVVTTRLAGCDVDPDAVAHCTAALRRWAEDHAVGGAVEPGIVLHDPLRAPTPFTGVADLVVGNPPFLAQRTSDTARTDADRASLRARFGDLGPYVDAAAAFLLVGAELLAPDGVAVLIGPQSILSARDAESVRAQLADRSELVALWADDARHFDADVEVCAPVLKRRSSGTTVDDRCGERTVEVRWGAAGDVVATMPEPSRGASWAPLLAVAHGVPLVTLPAGGPTIGDVASCTAGFRDEFYALAAAASTGPIDPGHPGTTTGSAAAPLVTVGMIDVCRLDRVSPRRLGGRRVTVPGVDLVALAEDQPRVAAWAAARQVPKVLVATQTKVIEAVADSTGALVPVTPVISVEPLPVAAPPGAVDVWHLVAVLSAPPVSAAVAADRAGSGLSSRALRLSAASLRSLPLPAASGRWDEAAAIARRLHSCGPTARPALLRGLGVAMCDAYGVTADGTLLEWWLQRSGARGSTGGIAADGGAASGSDSSVTP